MAKRFAKRQDVNVVHCWRPGRLLELRITKGRCSDLYVLCGYAPNDKTNPNALTAGKDAFFVRCARALGAMPNRCAIAMLVDANGGMEGALPHVGHASSRGRQRCRWMDNGRRLYDLLEQYELRATNTFGWAGGTSSTWRSPDGKSETRIDYVVTRMGQGARDRAHVLRNVPVALGFSRDHMIVEAEVCVRLPST